MTANIAKLVYFDKWMNGHALGILDRSEVIDLVHLQFASGVEANEAEQWIELFRGRVPPRLINPEVWTKYQQRFEQRLGFRPDDLTTR